MLNVPMFRLHYYMKSQTLGLARHLRMLPQGQQLFIWKIVSGSLANCIGQVIEPQG